MDSSHTPTETVTTAEEFENALSTLVQTAYANGVDIEGGWEARTPTEDPDWDIVILEVAKQTSAADDETS